MFRLQCTTFKWIKTFRHHLLSLDIYSAVSKLYITPCEWTFNPSRHLFLSTINGNVTREYLMGISHGNIPCECPMGMSPGDSLWEYPLGISPEDTFWEYPMGMSSGEFPWGYSLQMSYGDIPWGNLMTISHVFSREPRCRVTIRFFGVVAVEAA